jgi:hypothetical protein
LPKKSLKIQIYMKSRITISQISQENCGRLHAQYSPNLQHKNADDQTGTDEGREAVQRELGTIFAKVQKEGLSNSC